MCLHADSIPAVASRLCLMYPLSPVKWTQVQLYCQCLDCYGICQSHVNLSLSHHSPCCTHTPCIYTEYAILLFVSSVQSLPANTESVQQPAGPAGRPSRLPWDRQRQSPCRQGLIWWTAVLTPVSLYVLSLLSLLSSPILLPHPTACRTVHPFSGIDPQSECPFWPSSLRKHNSTCLV